jgi:hypothetical protein
MSQKAKDYIGLSVGVLGLGVIIGFIFGLITDSQGLLLTFLIALITAFFSLYELSFNGNSQASGFQLKRRSFFNLAGLDNDGKKITLGLSILIFSISLTLGIILGKSYEKYDFLNFGKPDFDIILTTKSNFDGLSKKDFVDLVNNLNTWKKDGLSQKSLNRLTENYLEIANRNDSIGTTNDQLNKRIDSLSQAIANKNSLIQKALSIKFKTSVDSTKIANILGCDCK